MGKSGHSWQQRDEWRQHQDGYRQDKTDKLTSAECEVRGKTDKSGEL